MLKIHTLPPTGGDTLWASGYEIYDRLSPAMQKFLEGLTATHDAKFFLDEAERLGNPIRKGIRGNALNFGDKLTAVHPVIRTNRTCLFQFNLHSITLQNKIKLMPFNSCNGLEIRLCEQGFH